MSNHVHWLLEVTINDGQKDNFRDLMNDMVEATKSNEPGALNYEWMLSSDEGSCHIYERYVDSEATMTHLGNFGAHFAERFLGCVTPVRIVVYGTPNEAVQSALAGFNAEFTKPFGGFAR